jgi:hypothetical protein
MKNKITTIVTILVIITTLVALTVTILTKPTPLIVTLFILLVIEGLILYVCIENDYPHKFVPEGRSHAVDSIVITGIAYIKENVYVTWRNSTANGVLQLNLRHLDVYSNGVDDEFAKIILNKAIDYLNYENNVLK